MEHFHQSKSLGIQGIELDPPYNTDSIPSLIRETASFIREAGGFLYLVGGCVRDILLGKQPKDWDCEVFGMDERHLRVELQEFGVTKLYSKDSFKQVGKTFPVWTYQNVDIALPRRERKVSEGHTGFEVEVDPNMTIKEAAERRDLTINAMYMDPLTSQIYDPYDGYTDLKNHRAHPVSHRFKEDPLRVMRAAQFCARFNLTPSKVLIYLSRELVDEFHTLSKERIWAEWEKLLQPGTSPALGLKFLVDAGWSKFFWKTTNISAIAQGYSPFNTYRDNLAMLYAVSAGLALSIVTGKRTDLNFLMAIHEGLYELKLANQLGETGIYLRYSSRKVDNVSLLKAWKADRGIDIAPYLEMLHVEQIWRSFHKPRDNGRDVKKRGFTSKAIAQELDRLYIEQMRELDASNSRSI